MVINRLKYLLFILFSTISSVIWGQTVVDVPQLDGRFTIKITRKWSVGFEEYKFYIQNNTQAEFTMNVDITLNTYCIGTQKFKLGWSEIVHLMPGGSFDATADDASHIYSAGPDDGKKCRKIAGNSYTMLIDAWYSYNNIVNVTAQKEQEEKDRVAVEAEKKRLAEEKKAREEADRKAAEEKRAKERAEKEAADKKALEEKNAADKVAREKAGGSTTDSTASDEGSAPAPPSGGSSGSGSSLDPEEEKRNAEARQAEAEKAAEDQAKAQDQAERNQRQAEYDAWKSQAKSEQIAAESAAMAGSLSLLMIAGGWIYNDKMGVADPYYVYDQPGRKKLRFNFAVEYGYSITHYPLIFASSNTTMINGAFVNSNSLDKKNAFLINFDAAMKLGLEHPNYGGYAVVAPKAGFSPIFDAFHLSSLIYGGRVYGGIKNAKLYAEMTWGARNIYLLSHDAEESGKGVTNNNFNKLEYGVRFTVNKDAQFRRSHVSIGVIRESMTMRDGAVYSPDASAKLSKGKTPFMQGFTFQWKKDHTFNLYCNYYPEYLYAGDITMDAGAPGENFKTVSTGTFFELGFIRSIDFW